MHSTNAPQYLHIVLEEFRDSVLELVTRSRFPMPDRLSPIAISVIKNEGDRLADFLRHYRSRGIQRFVFIDNGSLDGSINFLAAQPDVDLYSRPGKFNWMLKQGWINRIVERYGYDRWYLYADADEHIVYDGCEAHAFHEMTARMEQLGLARIRGFMIDMYADGPLLDSVYSSGGRLLEAYPWFDRDTYREAKTMEIISMKGGPRKRVFGANDAAFYPELTKYPLFKINPGEYMVNPHHIWPWDKNFSSARFLGILHFKFLPGLIDRIRTAVAHGNYWEGSLEYRRYLRTIEQNPDVELHCASSERLADVNQLVSLGLVASIDWEHEMSRRSHQPNSPLRSDVPGREVTASAPACMRVFVSTPLRSWTGWKPNPRAAVLESGGEVALRENTGKPGIDSESIAIETGGLYRIQVMLGTGSDPSEIGLNVRLSDSQGEMMGPMQPLRKAESEILFFVPHRTRAVMISILSLAPQFGRRFVLRSISLIRVDAERHYQEQKPGRRTPVIASMASIPSRRQMLRDSFDSLLLQCDRVRVFLNEYPDVPEFLNHPRADVRRSQDWDDKGDAGKFNWIETADEPGYRIVADDDMLYPPDFVQQMTQSMDRYGNRAIAAVHGVLVKHPFTNYYDPQSRTVFYFQMQLDADRTVHVLGTNALIYHSDCVKMSWSEFMYRNMADIFLARYAQRHGIPMICVARPALWVRQNKQSGGFETIYQNSLTRSRSNFDSSLVQDVVLQQIAPLTIRPTARPKMVLCLLATDCDAVDACLKSWTDTRTTDADWVLIVATTTDDPGLASHVAAIASPTEFHNVSEVRETPAERFVNMMSLAFGLRAACVCVAMDCIRFVSDAWTQSMAWRSAGPDRPSGAYGRPVADGLRFAAHFGANLPLPAVVIFNPSIIKWEPQSARGSRSAADALNALLACLAAASATVERANNGEVAGLTRSFRSVEAPKALARLSAEAHPELSLAARDRSSVAKASAVNEAFERVYVINLDRRADRWELISRGLDQAGIKADRFRAVDGAADNVAAEYAAYAAQPLATVGSGVRPVKTGREFFLDYESQRCRVAFTEAGSGRKAIASAGAWAYLMSWEQILEQALVEQVRSLLVFDDDVVFHKQAAGLFAQAAAELPDDWLMLQLGTFQFHWESDWMRPRGQFLYTTNGSAVGSHAVGVRLELVPFLLDHVKRRELPFDIGAVAAATRAFNDRCFVMSPNIAIQRLGDSDIRTSSFQATRDHHEIARTHRWVLEDYQF
jgi:hypothetical protein